LTAPLEFSSSSPKYKGMHFKMLEWPTHENNGNQISHGTHFL
jgi:hypothetical protein